MAFIIADRVRESTTTTGTGTINLAGEVSGFRTFVSAIGNNGTCYYAIVHRNASEWEVGLGTVTDASPDTLARTTILSSSNSGSAVDFSSGTKDVFNTYPAEKSVVIHPSATPAGSGLAFWSDEDNAISHSPYMIWDSGNRTLSVQGDSSDIVQFKDAEGDIVAAMTHSGVLNAYHIVSSGNVEGGNITGTLATASQPNITSVGTLGSLTVDNVRIEGTQIGHTSATSLLTLSTTGLTCTGFVDGSSLKIGGTSVTSTATELNFLDGSSQGTAIASKAVILDSNKDIEGIRNATFAGHDAWIEATGVKIANSGLLLYDSDRSNSVTVKPPAIVSTDYVFYLPSGMGTNTQVLTTDGTQTYWSSSGGGGGISFDGSTADGVLTFKDSDEATVESNMTYNGSLLTIASGTDWKGSHGNVVASMTPSGVLNLYKVFSSGVIDANSLSIGGTAITASATELNYVDGVSSAIQTQIDTKFDSGDDIVLAKHDAWVQATGVKVGNSGIVMDSVTIKTLQSSSESFADNDTSLMTSAAVADKIEAYGYTTNAGDITAVVAGSGMSGGATDGSATVTLDLNELAEVQIANGDFIPFIDATDSNAGKKESLADIATLFAGTNLTATNSVIAVDDAFLVNDANDTTTGTITAAGFTTTATSTASGVKIQRESASGVTIKSHAAFGDYSLILPSGTGSDGQILTSDGVHTYWADAAGGGAMSQFILEDDDGTEVSVSNNEEIKFIGDGITTNWTDTTPGSDGDPFDLTFTVDAAQTNITSIFATDVKIGEDDETKIDFETNNEIHFYADNAHQIKITDGGLLPVAAHDIDLGTYAIGYKNLYASGVYAGSGVAIHNHAGSGVNIKVPTSLNGFADYDLILPSGAGTAGQVLKSNAGGATYWATAETGASDINGLSDCLVENNSIFIGNDPSSTTSAALYNIGLGTTALEDITQGDGNVAIGYNASKDLTTGQYSVAIGYEANVGATTFQHKNVILGYQAGESNSSMSNKSSNVIIGPAAGKLGSPQDSVIIGSEAGKYIGDASSTQANVVAIGSSAMCGDSSDVAKNYGSVGIGYRAGRDKGRGTNAHYCIYLGWEAGYADADHASNMLYIANDEPSTTGAGGTIIKADMEEKHLAIGQADLLTNSAGDATLQVYPYEAADEAIYAKMPSSHTGDLIHIVDNSDATLFKVDSAGTATASGVKVQRASASGVTINSQIAFGDYVFMLPSGNGTNGQVLTTDSKNTYWSTISGGGISWDGSTANGVATYKDSDEATVESNLTFDGNTLTAVTSSSSATPSVIKGAASQTADLTSWQNSAGTSVAAMTSSGILNVNQIVASGVGGNDGQFGLHSDHILLGDTKTGGGWYNDDNTFYAVNKGWGWYNGGSLSFTATAVYSSNAHRLEFRGSGGTSNFTISMDDGQEFVLNEQGWPVPIRIEGDTNENLLYVDGADDKVAIGSSDPTYLLDVMGHGAVVRATGVIVGNSGIVLANNAPSVTTNTLYNDGGTLKFNGSTVGGGGGISFDGSTANGILTYKDSDEATVESNLTYDGSTFTVNDDMKVGSNGTGHDVILYSDTSNAYLTWSATQNTGLTVGTDGVGSDVKFFGDTAGAYALWDQSADSLVLGGVAKFGVGTTSPSYKVDVVAHSGMIRASGIKGNISVNADASTINFDLNASNTHQVILGNNRTLAVNNSSVGDKFIIRLQQDNSGSRTVTWWSNILWAGGSAPTLTTAANKSDTLGFIVTSGTGSSYWYDGYVVGQNL